MTDLFLLSVAQMRRIEGYFRIGIAQARLRMVGASIVFALKVLTLVCTLHQRAPTQRFTTKLALYLSGRSTPFVREAR